MTDITSTVELRCVGGPRNGEYVAIPMTEGTLSVTMPNGDRHYERAVLGWGFAGMNFEREVLVWDGLQPPDAYLVLMRRFVELLDEHRL